MKIAHSKIGNACKIKNIIFVLLALYGKVILILFLDLCVHLGVDITAAGVGEDMEPRLCGNGMK